MKENILCLQEAAAIIAQRTSNPREFFKQKEKAVATSLDTSPIISHRTGKTMGMGNEGHISAFLWGKE